MTMRIATFNSFDRGLNTRQQRLPDLLQLPELMTSGKRVARASDDPAAAARAERAMIAEMRTKADQRAVDASRNSTLQAESALGDAGELLQQAREHMISAGNASYSDEERQGLAVAIRGLREQLLSVANRGDGAGAYLFGGQGSSQVPFLQIGEAKYGKPILDRVIKPNAPLERAALCGLVSMEATIRSNLTVGPPIELYLLDKGSLQPGRYLVFEEEDNYLRELRHSWNRLMQESFDKLSPLVFPS